jgi:maltose O-acetyltransferase
MEMTFSWWRWRFGEHAPVVLGRVWLHGEGTIRFGRRVRIDGRAQAVELCARRGATLSLGDDVTIEGGASLEANAMITVGDRCLIGAAAKILDCHQHSLTGDRRPAPQAWPVVVEADVRLGPSSIVLPGARVRRGTYVPGGSVVRGMAAVPTGRSEPAGTSPRGGRVRSRLALRGLIPGLEALVRDPLPSARRILARARARVCLRRCRRQGRVYAFGPVRLMGTGAIVLGDRVVFASGPTPTILSCHRGATLEIGDGSIFNYAVEIRASHGVRIGRRCMLASRVRLRDGGPGGAPITLGDDVWLAHGVVVEPGVTIGEGAVVAAGSVVTRDVPARHLASGRPARAFPLEMFGPEPGARDGVVADVHVGSG